MKIASIDIGSNSVILLIAEVLAYHQKFTTILNKYSTPRIGKNLTANKEFDPLSVYRLKEVLKDFIAVSNEFGVELILPVATQAFRKARNANSIVREIKNELGIEIRILTGEQEGLLTYYGATSEKENYSGYVIDIGGGSTEIFLGTPGEINFSHSYCFGAVSICEKFNSVPPCGEEILDKIRKYVSESIRNELPLPASRYPATAVAGTPTTLACIHAGIREFDEIKIEGYKLSIENIREIINQLAVKNQAEILDSYGPIVAGREDVILTGSVILETLMGMLNLKNIYVSTRGLRHGVVYYYQTDRF